MKLAAALLAVVPAVASGEGERPLVGAWCNDLGDPVLYIEPGSLGLGEHRVCDWAVPPGREPRHESRVHCRQIYFDRGRQVVIGERDYEFRAEILTPGVLRARLVDGDAVHVFTYSPCEP